MSSQLVETSLPVHSTTPENLVGTTFCSWHGRGAREPCGLRLGIRVKNNVPLHVVWQSQQQETARVQVTPKMDPIAELLATLVVGCLVEESKV